MKDKVATWLLLPIAIFALPALSFAFEQCSSGDWEPISAGPLTTWSAPLCGKGKWWVEPFVYYNLTRGSFDEEGKHSSLPAGDKKSQFQEQLLLQYGLTDHLEIDGLMIYQQNYLHQNDDSASSHGWGDNYLFARYCFLEEQNILPHITGILQVKFPTGKYQKADPTKLGTDSMGTGSYDHGYGIIMTKKFKPFVFHCDAIYSFPNEVKVDGVETRYGRYLNYDFGVEYFFYKQFNLLWEINGYIQGDNKLDGDLIPASDTRYLNAATGVGWSCDKFQTLLVFQRTLTGTNTDANDSVVATCVIDF